MTDEEKNRQESTSIPLTTSESLTFFFIPFGFFGSILFKTNNDFNQSEMERFKTHGFDLKLKQARELTIFGRLFYIGITIILIYLL